MSVQYLPRGAWCCDGRVEVCPSRADMYYICEPAKFPNPAKSRPAVTSSSTSGIDSSSSTTTSALTSDIAQSPTPTLPAPASPSAPTPQTLSQSSNSPPIPLGAAVAVGAGGVVLLALIICGVYLRIKRTRERPRSGPSQPPVEVEAKPVPREIQGTPIHELEAGIPQWEL